MKSSVLTFLCLTACITIASSQYPISTAVIETRAQLFGKIYQWYQEIDAAYYDLYFQVKDSIADAFSPFRTHQLDILATFESTDLTELPENVAANFTTVIQRINQTLDMVQMYGNSYSMMSFSMYSLGDLTQLASSFRSLLSMPLSTFFQQFTMQMEPLTAECERKILSGIIPILEPYAQAHIKLAANASKNWVDSYEFNTIEVNLAILDVVTFADKIKICTRALTQAARVACFTRINQQYGCFPNCDFDQDLYASTSPVMLSVSMLSMVFYTPSMDWSMEIYNKVGALKNVCAVEPEAI